MREIPGVAKYYVNEAGEVFSDKRGILHRLKPYAHGKPPYYYRVTVWSNGRQRKLGVHTCVLKTFRGERPYGLVARHLNGISTDNRLENLLWGTIEENNADKIAHGHSPKGSRHYKAKLTEKQALMIYSYKPAGKRDHTGLADKLASEYNVCRDTVVKIWQRKIWTHIHNA